MHNLPVDGIVGSSTYRALWTLEADTGSSMMKCQDTQGSTNHYPSAFLQIDGGRCLLHHYVEGRLQTSYPIYLGSPNTPTPNGSFGTSYHGRSIPADSFGTRWLGLSIPFGAYGIHGTDNLNPLGKRTTHGCIYMLNPPALKSFLTTSRPIPPLSSLDRLLRAAC